MGRQNVQIAKYLLVGARHYRLRQNLLFLLRIPNMEKPDGIQGIPAVSQPARRFAALNLLVVGDHCLHRLLERLEDVLLQWPLHLSLAEEVLPDSSGILDLLETGVGRSIDEYHKTGIRPVHGQVCLVTKDSFGQRGDQMLRLGVQLHFRRAGLCALPLTLVAAPPAILRGSFAALCLLPLGLAILRRLFRLRGVRRLALAEHHVQLLPRTGGSHHLVGLSHLDPRSHADGEQEQQERLDIQVHMPADAYAGPCSAYGSSDRELPALNPDWLYEPWHWRPGDIRQHA